MTDAFQLERLVPGPIERVWDHLTQPDLRDTWLPEVREVTLCRPPALIEYAWDRDSSVRFELEARGKNVLLRLTHRRLRPALAGICTVLIAGVLAFLGTQPAASLAHDRQLGPAQLSLKFHSSVQRRLYGMLGGRC